MKILIAAGLFLNAVLLSAHFIRTSADAQTRAELTPELVEVLSHLSIVHLDDGRGGKVKTIRVSGANLQIVNGLGTTDGRSDAAAQGKTNGLGNLILGYAEGRQDTDRRGSHNVVIGVGHSYTSFGGLVVGEQNTISSRFASVTGGTENVASGPHSSVTGGKNNQAYGTLSSVIGGEGNIAYGGLSSVTGGKGNNAEGTLSSVTGGEGNKAGGTASVTGGQENFASGTWSSVNGGKGNLATGSWSTVVGGQNKKTTESWSVASGAKEQE
jgi:hypothetical protein